MKLYYSPGACSLAIHIDLREAGFNPGLEKVDLRGGKYSGGEYSKVNPKGYVPALELDDGEVLTEGVAIAQYIAEKKPESGLLPAAGSMERVRCLEWMTYISSEIHKSFSPLWKPDITEDGKAKAIDYLGKRVAYADAALKGKEYLVGNKFTIADAYLFTVMSWASFLKLDTSAWPNVNAFLARVAQRPKVQEAMKAEGLI